MAKVEGLHGKVMDYVSKVLGLRRELYAEAVQRTILTPAEALPATAPGFEDALVQTLTGIYPQKCEYSGESAVRNLIDSAVEHARTSRVSNYRGFALLTILSFMLGHRFGADPQVPWVSAISMESPGGDSNEQIATVYKRAQDYLGQTAD